MSVSYKYIAVYNRTFEDPNKFDHEIRHASGLKWQLSNIHLQASGVKG